MKLQRFCAFCQVEYCLNFIFRKTFPIHKLFERSCELGLYELTANKVSQIFGQGSLDISRESFLRPSNGSTMATMSYALILNVPSSNNMKNFSLSYASKFAAMISKTSFSKKEFNISAAVSAKFLPITDRFASFESQALQVHVDFPFFQCLGSPDHLRPDQNLRN